MTHRGKRVAVFIPSLRGGGVEALSVELTRAFAAAGVAVDLVLARAEGPMLERVDERVRVVDLGVGRIAFSLVGLVRYLRRNRPDALLSGMTHANIIALAARAVAGGPTRGVISIHNVMSIAHARSPLHRDRPLVSLARRIYPRADAVVCVSAGVADDVAAATGLPRGRLTVIPNAVPAPPAEEPLPASAHPWFHDPGLRIVLGMGRLVPDKGFDVLIDAFKRLDDDPGLRLVIAGEGRERDALARRVQELGLSDRVALTGFVNEPGPLLRRAAVLAAPSRREGFGNVIVEALGRGTPVIVSDGPGGPREIVDDGAFGTVVPVEDAAALARAILEVLERGEDAARLERRAANYRPEAVASRYLEVLLDAD